MKIFVWKSDDREVLLDTSTAEVIVRTLKSVPAEDDVVRFPIQALLDKYVQFCRPQLSRKK